MKYISCMGDGRIWSKRKEYLLDGNPSDFIDLSYIVDMMYVCMYTTSIAVVVGSFVSLFQYLHQ